MSGFEIEDDVPLERGQRKPVFNNNVRPKHPGYLECLTCAREGAYNWFATVGGLARHKREEHKS